MKKEHFDNANSINSFARKFQHDGQQILFELDGNDSLISTFTHSGLRTDDVLAVDKAGTSYFFLKDHLGTVNDIISSAGNLVQHYVYSPFGKIVRIENAAGADITNTPMVENFYTFTGREYDKESGLYYYRARYLDSETGRFIQSDPHPGVSRNPASFNSKYIYGNNDPLNRIDPMGTFNFRNAVSLMITAGITFGIGFGAGVFLGPVWGPIVGGVVGGAIGGEIAYRANRILGGSKEESSKMRQWGQIVGAFAGSMGGASGADYALTHPEFDTSTKVSYNVVDQGYGDVTSCHAAFSQFKSMTYVKNNERLLVFFEK